MIIIFKRRGGRGKKKRVEMKRKNSRKGGKKFIYLEVRFQKNEYSKRHRKQDKKNKYNVKSIGERKFKADFKIRMFQLDSLIFGVLSHGSEL